MVTMSGRKRQLYVSVIEQLYVASTFMTCRVLL